MKSKYIYLLIIGFYFAQNIIDNFVGNIGLIFYLSLIVIVLILVKKIVYIKKLNILIGYLILYFSHQFVVDKYYLHSIFTFFLLLAIVILVSNISIKNKVNYNIQRLFWSLFICSLTVLLFNIYYGDLSGAGLYNIDSLPFFVSTLDSPFLIYLTALIALSLPGEKNYHYKLVILLIVFLISYLFGRRSVLIAVIITLFVQHFNLLNRRTLYYLLSLSIMVAIFWPIISQILLYVTDFDVLKNVLVRNDPEEILTATNRSFIWFNSFINMISLDKNLLFGYGVNLPESLFSFGSKSIELTHLHNSLIQLFHERGIIILSIFVGLTIKVINSTSNNSTSQSILSFIFIVSAVESLYRDIYFTHLIVIVIYTIILSSKNGKFRS